MAENAKEGEADADCDADFEIPEDGGEEDDGHEEKLLVAAVAADGEEEEKVGRDFFEEGVGDDGYHGGEDAFLIEIVSD